ncbi:nitroreductase [Paractinoplanes rishiriensis]|uniref:NAD(P)H nitroreductase n=1 Tax=Paractinoplanes rishiriensis TaxID=1050105 RepID=A0A919JU61_9ACTN|nr:nitroreductase [Actinoplanes rishiriensis]GIE94860.1 NAD(P)H nitroreductase [Actinoplanes rishiriensis]
MDIDALTHLTDTRSAAKALVEAATTAGHAPSIHNTQPWRWRLTGNTLDLHLVRSRIMRTSDPDGRLATLSCGAALHHARVTMAAHGWQITVTRMLQGADADLLARLHVDRRSPIDLMSVRLLHIISSRYTDQGSVTDTPPGPEALTAITAAIEAQGTRLHTFRPDQLLELVAAADHAQRTQAADLAWQAGRICWTSIPDATAPGRDFGGHTDLPITARRDKAAVFVMLHDSADEPLNWLRAGEALSAGWLTATCHGVSVMPHSAPIETIATRQAMRAMIASIGYPYLVLRLRTVDPADGGTRRLPAGQIIERY